jgi:hypothetical protein
VWILPTIALHLEERKMKPGTGFLMAGGFLPFHLFNWSQIHALKGVKRIINVDIVLLPLNGGIDDMSLHGPNLVVVLRDAGENDIHIEEENSNVHFIEDLHDDHTIYAH